MLPHWQGMIHINTMDLPLKSLSAFSLYFKKRYLHEGKFGCAQNLILFPGMPCLALYGIMSLKCKSTLSM